MTTYFAKQFADNSNCLMLTEFNCHECNAHFLSNGRVSGVRCFDCGALLDGGGSIVLSNIICNHSLEKDRHEHHI